MPSKAIRTKRSAVAAVRDPSPAKAATRRSAPAKKHAADAARTKKRGNGSAPDDLQLGARVKHARLLAGIRMKDLAARVGCTESMVSKIESGRVVPSLPMLRRLVEALDRDLSSFFGSDINAPGLVLRAGQRPIALTDSLRVGHGVSYERMVPLAAGNLLECNIHVVQPRGDKQDPITHQGETVGYVIEGQIELTIDTTTYMLTAGDSFFFKNHLTNSYRNPGPGAARVIWVNTPQVH
jgi:transcriptional regulator with XRE-family HTH domain